MEPLAMAVGGARPCVFCSLYSSSSSLCSTNARNASSSLSYAPSQKHILGNSLQQFHPLAAFQSLSHLFSYPTSSCHAQKKQHKPRIFLPHLVASLEQVEQSYIMIKPDGVQRGLAWEGVGVVASARKLIGATNPLQAEPSTIRGDLAVQTGRNVVHGSDSRENGKLEIALWFGEGELVSWTPVQEPWLRE